MGICNCISRNKQLNTNLEIEETKDNTNINTNLASDLYFINKLQSYDNCIWPNKNVKILF